jgi:hypothetical protein
MGLDDVVTMEGRDETPVESWLQKEGERRSLIREQRRYKVAFVTLESFFSLLVEGKRSIVTELGFPRGSFFIHAGYEPSRNALAVVGGHESFEKVELGVELPQQYTTLIESRE